MISVIVPINNGEKFLCDCLNSIINQTYRNLEILLIDDGSTDKTNKICSKFCNIDKRIIYLYKEKQGVAIARNLGLKYAQGDYIAFVDSDDIIHYKYFEYLYEAINNGPYNIAMTLYKNYTSLSGLNNTEYNINYHTKSLSQEDFINKLFLSMKVGEIESLPLGVVWGKLYRKKFLENILFKNLYISSDIEFSSRSCWSTGDLIVIPERMYYWRIHDNSLSHKNDNSTKKLESELDLWLNIISNIPDFLKLKNYRGVCLEQLYKKFLHLRNMETNICSSYKSQIVKYKFELLSNNFISVKTKISIILFYNFPFLLRLYNKLLVK